MENSTDLILALGSIISTIIAALIPNILEEVKYWGRLGKARNILELLKTKSELEDLLKSEREKNNELSSSNAELMAETIQDIERRIAKQRVPQERGIAYYIVIVEIFIISGFLYNIVTTRSSIEMLGQTLPLGFLEGVFSYTVSRLFVVAGPLLTGIAVAYYAFLKVLKLKFSHVFSSIVFVLLANLLAFIFLIASFIFLFYIDPLIPWF